MTDLPNGAMDRGVLFAELCESSHVLREIGDQEARQVIGDVLRNLRQVAEDHSGMASDELGHELICIFGDVRSLTSAAVDMQEKMRSFESGNGPRGQISIRIGLHFGSVSLRDGRFVGEGVFAANRMVTLAKGRQVLITPEILDHLGKPTSIPTRFVDFTTILGRSGKCEVHELIWDTETVTWDYVPPNDDLLEAEVLEVSSRGERFELDGDRPVLTIGRAVDCDLVIGEPPVSRHHARLEQRDNGFVYVDYSTNGSFILSQGQEWNQVQRGEVRIVGSGMIVLGLDRNGTAILHFRTLDLDATIPNA